jgi:sigma-B regulation protein RsbU (phosphoserine phosphatase)
MNRFLNERTQGEKYATIFYCTLDRRGRLRWTCAGHCAPLLVRSGGSIESLEANGLPVGMMEEAAFPVAESQLSPGDKLVIFTDGVCEAQNAGGEFFEARRLRRLLKESGPGSTAGQLLDRLIAALRDFTAGAEQADDMTCLILEYRG